MNSLLCVGFLCAFAHLAVAKMEIPPEMKEMLDGLQSTCLSESGVDNAVVEAAKKLDIKPDPKFKCFLKCMMTNLQVLTDEGVFDEDIVINHLPDAFKELGAVDVVHKCKTEKGSDACDTAYKLVVCFSKHAAQFAEVFT